MICMSLAPVKVRGADGVVRELRKGEIFYPKNPETLTPLIATGKIKIVENEYTMTPGRRRTLEEVADAILLTERDKVIQIGRWKLTPEAEEAERQINRLYNEVLEGRGKLIDFGKACARWRKEGTK